MKNIKTKYLIYISGITLALLANVALATTNFSLVRVEPAETVVVAPGKSILRNFILRNNENDKSITVKIEGDNVDYSKDEQKRTSVPSTWASFSNGGSYQLEPSSSASVQVKISIPTDAVEGLYQFDFAAQTEQAVNKITSGSGVRMSEAIGNNIRISVQKEAEGVQPTESNSYAPITYYGIVAILLIIILILLVAIYRRKRQRMN